MINILFPDEYLDSTYDIDFEALYAKGYRGVLFDIDNTLVPHDAPADDRAKGLFARLRKIGFETCVISNNKEPRVKSFADDVGCHYIYKADKPLPDGFRKAMKEMGTKEYNTLFVGDQIFTDVFGAKLSGIFSIMVKPIHPKEEIQIVLKRRLEKIVLYFYEKDRLKKAKDQ